MRKLGITLAMFWISLRTEGHHRTRWFLHFSMNSNVGAGKESHSRASRLPQTQMPMTERKSSTSTWVESSSQFSVNMRLLAR